MSTFFSKNKKVVRKFCIVTTSPLIVEFFLIPHLKRLVDLFEVTLIANEDCSNLLERENLGQVRMINIPIKREISVRSDFMAFLNLSFFFIRERFDAVVTVAPKAGLIGIFAAFVSQRPFRCHIFQGEVWALKHGIMRWVLKSADRLVAYFATHILVVSSSERDFLIGEGILSRKKSQVLGSGSICGVNGHIFRSNPLIRTQIRSKYDIPDHALLILYLGRVKRDKGVVDIVRAWIELVHKHPELHLAIVGPDEDNLSEQIRRMANLGVVDRLHIQGRTLEPQAWIAAADILSLPSYREGFGMVLIEAGSAGLPVVASRIYGISDAMIEGVTGLSYPPGNLEELASCLEKLIENPALRHQLGNAGKERVIKEFGQDVVVSRYIEFWDSLIK